MNCRQAEKLILSYVLADKDPQKHQGLSSHLEGCPRCNAYLESQKRLKYALADALSIIELPPHLASNVQSQLEQMPVPKARPTSFPHPRWKLLVRAGAAGLVCGLIVAVIVHLRQEKMPSALSPEMAAEVVEVTGSVQLKRQASPDWKVLQAGEKLLAGDLISTGAIGSVELRLDEKGKLHMYAASLLRIEQTRKLTLKSGTIGLDVMTAGNPFVVAWAGNQAQVSRGKLKVSLEPPVHKASAMRLALAAPRIELGRRASLQAASAAIGWMEENRH